MHRQCVEVVWATRHTAHIGCLADWVMWYKTHDRYQSLIITTSTVVALH